MKLAALDEIERRSGGYRVAFERREGCILAGDHVPDRDEPPCATEQDAWALVDRVARALPEVVNIYVVHASDWTPVAGYSARMVRPR